MLDPEALVQRRPRNLEKPVGIARPGSDDMRGQRGFGRAQRPDMKVVHCLDPLYPFQRVLHFLDVDTAWDPRKGHSHGFLEKAEGAPQDDQSNGEAHRGVDPFLPGPQDDESGEDHRKRHQRVRRHVQEGALDIDVMLAAPGE